MKSIAVLLPVYNSETHLREAIDSILLQSFGDYNFYIINDGSTDSSEEVILSYSDKRIIYLKNEQNKGLVFTLNKGIEAITEKYIVRMDADDIAFENRLEFQLKYMEDHPACIVCGSQTETFGEEFYLSNLPISFSDIKTQLIFNSPIAHPTVIIRTEILKKNDIYYSDRILHMEDYYLWLRLSELGELHNLPYPLLKYRMSGQNITIKNWSTREERLKLIYKKILRDLEIEPNEDNLRFHLELGGNTKSINNISKLRNYSKELIVQNGRMHIYSQISLKNYIQVLWNKVFFKVADIGFWETVNYWFQSKSVSIIQLHYFLGIFRFKILKPNK